MALSDSGGGGGGGTPTELALVGVAATAVGGARNDFLVVSFSEDVEPTEATQGSNYVFEHPRGVPVDLAGVSIGLEGGTNVRIVFDRVDDPVNLQAGELVQLTVTGVHRAKDGAPIGTANSRTARVEGDDQGPEVTAEVQTVVGAGNDFVAIRFSEAVKAEEAVEPERYEFRSVGPSGLEGELIPLDLASPAFDPAGLILRWTFAGVGAGQVNLKTGERFELTVKEPGVPDLAGNRSGRVEIQGTVIGDATPPQIGRKWLGGMPFASEVNVEFDEPLDRELEENRSLFSTTLLPIDELGADVEPVDWDNDGDLDLLIGGMQGTIKLYLNTGSQGASDQPTFVFKERLLASGNPRIPVIASVLDQSHVAIYRSQPTRPEIDAVVVGRANGTLRFFYNENRSATGDPLYPVVLTWEGDPSKIPHGDAVRLDAESGEGPPLDLSQWIVPPGEDAQILGAAPAFLDNGAFPPSLVAATTVYYTSDEPGLLAEPRKRGVVLLFTRACDLPCSDPGRPTGYEFARVLAFVDVPHDRSRPNRSETTPAWTDYDGDGDRDLVVSLDEKVRLFENVSDVRPAPTLIDRGWIPDTLTGQALQVPTLHSIAMAEMRVKGFQDLVAGSETDGVWFFRNHCASGRPACLSSPVRVQAMALPVSVNLLSAPLPFDYDGDGDLDLLMGSESGTIFLFRNASAPLGAGVSEPRFGRREELADAGALIGGGRLSVPALVDIDRDGDLDLAVASRHGTVTIFPNMPDPDRPREALFRNLPIRVERLSGGLFLLGVEKPIAVTFGHLEDPDAPYPNLIVGDSDGRLTLFRIDETASNPEAGVVFVQNLGSVKMNPRQFPLFCLNAEVSRSAAPFLVDYDNDGRLDLVIGSGGSTPGSPGPIRGGAVTWLRNLGEGTGSCPAAPVVFEADVPSGDPLPIEPSTPTLWEFELKPVYVDLDGDRDRDLLVGNITGIVTLYLNTSGRLGEPPVFLSPSLLLSTAEVPESVRLSSDSVSVLLRFVDPVLPEAATLWGGPIRDLAGNQTVFRNESLDE